jgi:23S rRNA (cytidine2498-2'-O)-methyltransferase
MTATAYLAHPDFIDELVGELGDVRARHDRLLIARGPARAAAWAQNIWYEPQRVTIPSIGEAAKTLRGMQRGWAHYACEAQGRAKLIAEKLPHVSGKPLVFPQARPAAPLGSWTLLDRNTLLCAPHCSSAFSNGEVPYVEDKVTPPTRAYLKLWEALTLLDERPGPGDLCLDLGSCPGGWTWVVQQLGARVISVDKAPLDPAIAGLPNIEFRAQSAFALDPQEFERIDWLFCDVACYPKRLLTLVKRWIESGICRRIVCTIKLQGPTDQAVLREFAEVRRSTTRHLWHNKHELTWTWRMGE